MSRDVALERWPDPKTDRAGFKLYTPFDQSLVDEIKALPAPDRKWLGDAWWIAEEHEETVTGLVLEVFGSLRLIGDDGDEILTADGKKLKQGKLL